MNVKAKIAALGAAGILALAAPVVLHFEGTYLGTYADPVGIPTICTGHTGPEVSFGQVLTNQQCADLLDVDLLIAYNEVKRCVFMPLKDHEAAALVSFAFNVGGYNFCSSTLVRLANAGDMPGACAQLSRWVYSRGIKFNGLIKRRAAERALCEGRAS